MLVIGKGLSGTFKTILQQPSVLNMYTVQWVDNLPEPVTQQDVDTGYQMIVPHLQGTQVIVAASRGGKYAFEVMHKYPGYMGSFLLLCAMNVGICCKMLMY